ncbi:MAG: A/G-specific adenine glycosylase [Armatimonadota bacterium]|nr:A/G-specific adenine glycosylase [Armatimonadota bacterium]MDR7439093.1 A/G-specific adenine glycosylase [Armatimonadota bacterium]MDR7563514.1 A/G-specific adenine glycosylase [Armatimonadota bacterium]MDR7567903.1 A/G-specific adenine glycosylase [Armatimonadota bacterium]MDR7602690.1 A/G-specific adenine glycosylase [Armatimonadota bacterium]
MDTALSQALLLWYARAARPLPWRATRDPYAIWVAEVLLQQTRVEAAIPYYHRFLAAFPTVESLAAAEEEEVLRVWAGLGYYARARNLHRAARRIVREGGFPATVEGWRRLPGVGPYTAAAVSSIAFGQNVLALDGNALRVGTRLLGIDEPLEDPRTRLRIRTALEALIPEGRAGEFNQALMDLGATVCLARSPRCGTCPVRPWCRTAAQGLWERIPARRAKPPKPHRHFVAALVRDAAGRVLVVRQPPRGLWGGLWTLPQVEARTWKQARPRLERVLGVRLRRRNGKVFATLRHAFTHFLATFHVVEASPSTLPAVGRFTSPCSSELPLPAPARRILGRLNT